MLLIVILFLIVLMVFCKFKVDIDVIEFIN